jgi:hypothetical protein
VSSAPIQLRVVLCDDGNGNEVRTLEMRHSFAVDASGGFCPGRWTEWEKVPEFGLPSVYEADEKERVYLAELQARAIYGSCVYGPE